MPRAQVRVDLDAIEGNVAALCGRLASGTQLCAVVKADGYGHGAVPTARAARAGGATWLAVVTGREALELREAGIECPILVLGALDGAELALACHAEADIGAWSTAFVRDLGDRDVRVHVKLDTGLGRLGERDPVAADAVIAALGERTTGLWTHLATADMPGDAFFAEQLRRFDAWAGPHRERDPTLVRHAANSAGVLRDSGAHFDLVRCGVAIYGMDPFGEDPAAHGLEPALALHSYVAAVKECKAGDSVGYGRRFVAASDTRIATLPIGYGDGWRRGLSGNADVLIRGRRYPVAGTISMDNTTVDVGLDTDVAVYDDVTLIGGDIRAEEVARRLDTINYDVTTGLLPRSERYHHRQNRRTDR